MASSVPPLDEPPQGQCLFFSPSGAVEGTGQGWGIQGHGLVGLKSLGVCVMPTGHVKDISQWPSTWEEVPGQATSASGLAGMEGGRQQPGAWAEQTGRRTTSSICVDAAAQGRHAGPGVLSAPASGRGVKGGHDAVGRQARCSALLQLVSCDPGALQILPPGCTVSLGEDGLSSVLGRPCPLLAADSWAGPWELGRWHLGVPMLRSTVPESKRTYAAQFLSCVSAGREGRAVPEGPHVAGSLA